MDERVKRIIDKSEFLVFFGGAGVSTESSIPDFRSEDGLYAAKEEYGYAPEQIISHSFFMRNPETFYLYYKKHMLYPNAEPNPAHYALARLESEKKLKVVITQNIDGLHQKAGSKNVYELHGSVLKNYCMNCNARYNLEFIVKSDGVPSNSAINVTMELFHSVVTNHSADGESSYTIKTNNNNHLNIM